MNNQRSLKDQLDQLEQLAVIAGLYDAQDWVKAQRILQDDEIKDAKLQIHSNLTSDNCKCQNCGAVRKPYAENPGWAVATCDCDEDY